MKITDIFSRKTDSNNYMEIEYDQQETKTDKMLIDVEKIESYMDSSRIQSKLREGKIIFAKIKSLKERDMGELKRTIAKIRKTCIAIDGDIAGIGNDWVVFTPSSAQVHRSE